jgi:cell division protein FtsQ
LKKINYKKVIVVIAWCFAVCGIALSLSFINKQEKNLIVSSININITNPAENSFLNETDVQDYFNSRNELLLNNQYKNINIPLLEKALNNHPSVANAEISADLNGELKIDVEQRKPILRIINQDGESYYIDSQSKLMPLSENYTARVLVANGIINEPYARRSDFTVTQIKNNPTYNQISVLDDLWDLTTYINQDSTLIALIHQINVTKNKEIELIPVMGDHKIIFGQAINIEEKFNKLKVFYKEGLTKTNSWNKYSAINIKYKNIIVGTKKTSIN